MSGGNTILNDEIAVDLNSSTNKYLRYRVENIFYTIIDSNNKVDRLISYHEGINTPVRLILNSSNKKGVKKEKIVGAVDLSTGIIPLLSSLFFTDVIVKGFVNDKGVNVRVKTASDLNVNLLNYLHSNIDRKLTIKSTLELLAAAYIAIYLGDYPQGLRQLVLEAVNQPVNINGKSYIVGLPIDPNGRRGDSLFMPVNNILHYSVDYNTISLAIYLTMWITTILVLFTIIFFIYRKKDYK